MAEDIIVFDPSTDEEDDKPVVAPSRRNDSSSDSDDSQPVMKKSRSTARWRSRPPLEDVSNETQAPTIGLYSVSGKLDLKANIPDIGNTEDLDEEEKVIKLPMKKKSSKPSRAVTREKISRIPEPDICLVDDDDDDDNDDARVNSSSSGRDRSPTPPPSLTGRHLPIARRRKARTPRGTKQAIGNLESLRCRLRTEKIIDRLHMHDADDVVEIDDGHDSQSPQKELNVKIRSVNGIRRFLMGKNESFARVLKEMAEKEGVSEEHIVLYHKDEVIMPYNTPRLLNLTIADILDCHTIVRNADDEEEDEEDDLLDDIDDPTMVRLKLRGKNKRAAAVTIRIKKTDPLEKLMREYALKCSLPFETLTFHFDGDLIGRGQTAIELDMEDDDCIDVGSNCA